eukprot:m.3237 g.3237  ORF g.3237 m.3237 type:complete len:77 (+) comp2166_c0_seq1:380-610(+)
MWRRACKVSQCPFTECTVVGDYGNLQVWPRPLEDTKMFQIPPLANADTTEGTLAVSSTGVVFTNTFDGTVECIVAW